MKTFDTEIIALDGSKIIKHGNDAPAWMTTYADLMSLLFALFVLLLSFSEVNDNSFKKNAGPMREAFNENSDFKTNQESYNSGGLGILPGVKTMQMDVPEGEQLRENMLEQLRRSLTSDLADKSIELEPTVSGAIIRFPSNTAFESGGVELLPSGYAALDKIAPILLRTPGDIKVGGHTDDVAISTAQFRSNWDLSAARATSVVHYLLGTKRIPKERLTSQGYADSRPLVANDTPEHRAINRRVEISIEIPNDPKEAAKLLKRDEPRRRIWTLEEGQREITPETKAIDPVERRRIAKEKAEEAAKRLNEKSGIKFQMDMQSIGR
jgi:chemotaxis protein MotB